jgi:hypothetical protein
MSENSSEKESDQLVQKCLAKHPEIMTELVPHLKGEDASLFACEMDACIIGYIQNWEIRAKAFANLFEDRRLDGSLLDALDDSGTAHEKFERMNQVTDRFVKELHATVTTLELHSLVNRITLLLLKNNLPEWSDSRKNRFKEFLSTGRIERYEGDGYTRLKSVTAGAIAGASVGLPFGGVGAFPGAFFGAVAGFFVGNKLTSTMLINETKVKILRSVDHSVRKLNARKDEVVRRALAISSEK